MKGNLKNNSGDDRLLGIAVRFLVLGRGHDEEEEESERLGNASAVWGGGKGKGKGMGVKGGVDVIHLLLALLFVKSISSLNGLAIASKRISNSNVITTTE